MNKFIVFLLVTIFSISTVWANSSYPFEIVKQSDQRWRFKGLKAYQINESTRISGRLTANHRFALPRGHIDVAAYSSSGELIAETTTRYIPAILTYRIKRKGGVRFSTTFDQRLPQGAIIKVAFHSEPRIVRNHPPHSSNIAK